MEHKQFGAVVTDIDEDQGIVETIFAVMGNIDEAKTASGQARSPRRGPNVPHRSA